MEHGNKLKNEDSAKKYYRQKLRTGKAGNGISPEEKKHREKIKKQGSKKAAEIEKGKKTREAAGKKERNVSKSSDTFKGAASGVSSGINSLSDAVNNDDDGKGEASVAEEVFDLGGNAAMAATRYVSSKVKSSNYSGKVHGKRELSEGGSEASRERQRKEVQRMMMQKKAQEAKKGTDIGQKAAEKTEDAISAFGEWLQNLVEEHPAVFVIILVIPLIVILCAGLLGSCAALSSGIGDVVIVTSYTADDEDILAVEADYKDLETELQDYIDNIDTDGYDEVNYYLDEVGHNPYQLAAILTVIFEAYTRDEVQGKLQEIFELQYEVTVEEKVETREREVEKTESYWVEDYTHENGGYWVDCRKIASIRSITT